MQKELDASQVPSNVLMVVRRLRQAGYQAYLVGGCVRDVLIGRTPHDWDVATDAWPHDVERLFERTYAVGARFGTVSVLTPDPVEVTTFRYDLGYQDSRRPSQVIFGSSIEHDLGRRDFTINALAWDPLADVLVDPFGGVADLAEGIVRAVGDPEQRFREDALRMLRAVRFCAQLHFALEPETWQAIEREAPRVQYLSNERIRDELLRLLGTDLAGHGIWLLHELGLLRYTLPELINAARLPQGKPGAPTLLDHLIQTVDACPSDPILRFAALLHDIGKLTTRQVTATGRVIFHGHEAAGEEVARKVCRRLRFSKKDTERIASLIRMHMVSGDEVGKKAVRRWVSAYDEGWVRDLIALRRADHVASGGDPHNNPFADRLEAALAEVMAEATAFTRRDLAVNGHDVMQVTHLPPGPRVGRILDALFEKVLDNPALNTRETLLELAKQIADEN